MYDPVIGRFNSVDPMADEYPGWSPYNYTLNNSLKYIDPTGLCPEETNDSDDSVC
jgi:RHS repeat-associated protein